MPITAKYWIKRTLLLVAFGLVLKVLLGIDLVDFALIVSGWMFFGGLITLDDELPGGFFNPDGEGATPYFEIAGLGLAFAGLLVLKLWIVEG